MTKTSIFQAFPVLLAASLLAVTPAVSAQVDVAHVQALRALVDAGRYQEAYVLAQEGLFYNEGDPDFDFLYGLSALESGRPDEAVFALERVAHTHPGQARVQLELARAYYMSNNLPAARELFTQVLEDSDPEPNVTANINAFLDAIETRADSTRSTLQWFVSSSLGSDSNINSATELGVISTPIGDVELRPDGRSIDDQFIDFGGGFVYNRPLDKNRSFSVGGQLNQHDNLGSGRFDLSTALLEGAYALRRDDQRYSAGLRHQRVLLGGDAFQNSSSLLGTWQRSLGDGWSQALTAAYSLVRYDNSANNPDNALRDVNQALFSGVVGKLDGRFHHSLSLYWGDEGSQRSQGRYNAQRFYGVAFAEQYQLSREHVPFLRLSLHRSENKQAAPLFGKVREDDTLSATFGWQWRLDRQLDINADLTWTDNDSNIGLYAYDRVKIQTGFRYRFQASR